MRGSTTRHRGRARARTTAATIALAIAVPTFGLVVATAPAQAADTIVPGTMSTEAQNTSTFSVPVPVGTTPSAITGVLTQPQVTPGSTVNFTVNGRPALSVPSTLYRKVTIPVTASDVIADGTIALTMTTAGAAVDGAICTPSAGSAAMRKIGLTYTGTETAPTTAGTFFPKVATAVYVVIPTDANDEMITAGLTAVTALASKYDDNTPITLNTSPPDPATVTAGSRVVSLVEGRAGEVTATVSADTGMPTLTLTGTGTSMVDAARALAADGFDLTGSGSLNPSAAPAPRVTSTKKSLARLGSGAVTLTGYGSTTQQVEVKQDDFGGPVEDMKLHLTGSHTAFADGSGARLDVRLNGTLVGSTTLGSESSFTLDAGVPANALRSVNDLDLTLTAIAPDGSACTPPSIPPAEVDLDTTASTISVSKGYGSLEGFQLYPQAFNGTVPIALRTGEGKRATAATNAAAILVSLQRAASTPLEVELMSDQAFLADKRNGLFIGAIQSDAATTALDAPLKLSATRELSSADKFRTDSQEPYAVLESVDSNDRLILMLGSWAPGNGAAKGELARKVVDFVTTTTWAGLADLTDGPSDLVIADGTNPAFAAASHSLKPHQVTVKKKSYAKWFVLIIAVLLLLLALQVVIAIRRDRRVASGDDETDGPAYVEDEGYEPEVDELGDVDDLDVLEYADDRTADAEPADYAYEDDDEEHLADTEGPEEPEDVPDEERER